MLHAFVDAVVWIWVLIDRESVEQIFAASVLDDGADLRVVLTAGLTIVFGVAAILAFTRLATIRAGVIAMAEPGFEKSGQE